MLWYFQRLVRTTTGHVIDEADSLTEAQAQWPGVTVRYGLPAVAAL
jgi:hypothetical protein